MFRTRPRRFCILLVAVALTIGPSLIGAWGTVPQPALAAGGETLPCAECACCEDKGTTFVSACGIICPGAVSPVPGAKVTDAAVSAGPLAGTCHHLAGITTAPDPSPPRHYS